MIYISYTLSIVALGAMIIGFVTGVLSYFFISRRQSILGDAISHSTLAGITVIFLLLRTQFRFGLMIGALGSGFLTVVLIYLITAYTPVKSDAATGIVLSFLFGIGIVLLSIIQRTPGLSQAGLKHYLFGNIAFLRYSDLPSIFVLSIIVLGTIMLFWKELKLVSYDPEYAKTIGLRVNRYELLILVLVVITVVIGVELIGVVMVAGLLIGPGLAARQWTDRFTRVVLLSGLLGAIAGVAGAVSSAMITNLPTGPMIIVIIGIIVMFSISLSKKGFIWHLLTVLWYRMVYDVEESIHHLATHMLMNPSACDIREFDIKPDHERSDVTGELPAGKNHQLYDDLNVLNKLGYIQPREGGNWILTHRGMEEVYQLGIQMGVKR